MSTVSDLGRLVFDQRKFAAGELNLVIARHDIETYIDFYDKVVFDIYGTVTVGEWGGYLIQIMPMAFNDRLVMTPKHTPSVYDFGWCYNKGAAPLLAALVWNPQAEAEPKGFKKRASAGLARIAGQRATLLTD